MIESIEFKQKFLPFKKGNKIDFSNKENEKQKELIKFYLKTNGKDENFADRIKIDVIVGNNGSGKSRLFEGILTDNINISPKHSYQYILDDFFIGSKSISKSVNYDFIKKTALGEKTLLYIFNLLNDNIIGNNKKIFREYFSGYLNMGKNMDVILKMNICNNFEEKKLGGKYIPFVSNNHLDENFDSRTYLDRHEFNSYQFAFLNFIEYLFYRHSKKTINNNKYANLNKMILDQDVETIIFSISDIIIYNLNYFRNKWTRFKINDDVNNPNVYDNNFDLFKKALLNLNKLLNIISIDNIEHLNGRNHVDYNKSIYSKKFNHPTKILKIWNNLKDNVKDLIKILDHTKDNINLAEKLSQEKFGLNLHGLIRHISGYEYMYVNGREYFFIDLVFGFSKIGNKKEEKDVINTIENIIYYKLMNSIERDGLKKVSFDNIKNVLLSNEEKSILSLPIFDLKLLFKDKNNDKSFNDLSGGEKTSLIRFMNIIKKIFDTLLPDNINGLSIGNSRRTRIIAILIDEPDLHLHLDWQKKYIEHIINVFYDTTNNLVTKDKFFDIKLHFIIATHSPFIISDVPKENIILLKSGEQINNEKQIFGANYIDLINNGFFFEGKTLIGSFAEKNIKNLSIAKKFLLIGLDKIKKESLDEKEIKIYDFLEKNENRIDDMIDNIGDDFLKENLLYL